MGNRHHALRVARQANALGALIKVLDLRGCNVYNIAITYTPEAFMRTNIVIDDSLMNQALKVSGFKTKRKQSKKA